MASLCAHTHTCPACSLALCLYCCSKKDICMFYTYLFVCVRVYVAAENQCGQHLAIWQSPEMQLLFPIYLHFFGVFSAVVLGNCLLLLHLICPPAIKGWRYKACHTHTPPAPLSLAHRFWGSRSGQDFFLALDSRYFTMPNTGTKIWEIKTNERHIIFFYSSFWFKRAKEVSWNRLLSFFFK